MRQAVKRFSRRGPPPVGSESPSDADEEQESVVISKNFDDELICYMMLCLKNRKKLYSQHSTMDQIQAALPMISSSPHDSLMDRLVLDLQHDLKYQKLTLLLQNESEGFKEMMMNQTVILSSEEWGKLQMLLNILVQHYEEPLLHALLAKTILNREAGKILEAIQWARRGLEMCDTETPDWLPDLLKRALSTALSTAAAHCILSTSDRRDYRSEATELLIGLSTKHKDDSLILYNLAVALAEAGKYSAAIKAIKAAMVGEGKSIDPIWALYALILSANRDYDGALKAIDGGLTECSQLYEPILQIIKSQLLMRSGFPNEGIGLLSSACSRFKTEPMTSEVSEGWREIKVQYQEMLSKELMEIYLSQGRLADAEYCVGQMEQVRSSTPDLLYMKGRVQQEKMKTQEAIRLFEMALSINPNHEATTLALGRLYLGRGKALLEQGLDGSSDLVLAQSLISNIIQVLNPNNYMGWYILGLVFKAQGQYDESKKHLQHATSIASVSPVKGFSILPRLF